MVLVADIGNTNIVLGVGTKGGNFSHVARFATDTKRTQDEYIYFLRQYRAEMEEVPDLEGAVLSSVVPELTQTISEAMKSVFHLRPLQVNPSIQSDLQIKTDHPSIIGADFICDAVGAIAWYPMPAIVLDMGTATKFFVLSEDRDFLGAVIMPGVKISLDALSQKAAQLPYISLEDSPPLIGKNTIDCMRSGVIHGAASMVDGMIDRFQNEVGEVASIIATGGLSRPIVSHCTHPIVYDEHLLLKGMVALHEKNSAQY